MARDLMGHVLLPGWKDIINHQGSVFNMKYSMTNGLIPGGNESGRQTVSFSPLNPLEPDGEEEEYHDNTKTPRNFHFCSKWKHDQDAVYWVKIGRDTRVGITILANEVKRHHCT